MCPYVPDVVFQSKIDAQVEIKQRLMLGEIREEPQPRLMNVKNYIRIRLDNQIQQGRAGDDFWYNEKSLL